MSGIYGNGVTLNEKMLDYLWARQEVTLNNITNDDTPGFKAQYITFEDEMRKRLVDASASRSPRQAVADGAGAYAMNILFDQEQLELVRTAYEYQYILSSISNDISRLKSAARTF